MVESGSWNWNKVSDAFWSEPAEEVYYLVQRWKETGRLTMLDLGCGLGRHSLLFAEHRFRVIGLDSSDSGLRRLKSTAEQRGLTIHTVRADLIKLPFEANSYDAVLAYHSIYHVDSAGIAAAIAECHRILRPTGEVYLTLNSKSNPTFTDPDNQIIDEHVRMKREEDGSILPHFYCDLADVHRLLSSFRIIGLKQVENIYEGRTSWHYFVHASALK